MCILEQTFFGALQEQVPELAAYLDDNSDDEYQVDAEEELIELPAKSSRKSSTKKAQQQSNRDVAEPDDMTTNIMKKFRHVNVQPAKKSRRKSQNQGSTTISTKNRADELYIVLDKNASRTVLPGSHLDSTSSAKKPSKVQSFSFHRRPVKVNAPEDTKAPWRCILCWKEPYEEYLGPLFGTFPLDEACRLHLNKSQ